MTSHSPNGWPQEYLRRERNSDRSDVGPAGFVEPLTPHGRYAAISDVRRVACQGEPAPLDRRRWAALIKHIYQPDPLLCPRCGGTMKIIAFIEAHQADLIRKILEHCGLWHDPPPCAPPRARAAAPRGIEFPIGKANRLIADG